MDTGSLVPLRETCMPVDRRSRQLCVTFLSRRWWWWRWWRWWSQPWTSCWVNFRHQSLTPAKTSSFTLYFFLFSFVKNVINSFSSKEAAVFLQSSCFISLPQYHTLFIMIITHFQGWKRRKTQEIRMKEMTNKGIYKIMQPEIDLPSKIIVSFISFFPWQSLFLNDQQLLPLLFSFLWCHQRKECVLQQQISLWHVIVSPKEFRDMF